MSRKKPLSSDEKKVKILEIFRESDFWQLKDIEKIASKEKGVVEASVKEILMELVEDNFVTSEKIGVSNYFWAFPSAELQKMNVRLATLQTQHDELKNIKDKLDTSVENEHIGREDGEERALLLKSLADAKSMRKGLIDQLQVYKDCDPIVLQNKEKSTKECIAHVNRWTDNIFALQSYCSNNFGMSSKDFFSQFGLSEDFDTI